MADVYSTAWGGSGDIYSTAFYSGSEGAGTITLPSTTVAGVGTVSPSSGIIGNGNIQVPQVVVNGIGAVTTGANTGALFLPVTTVSGIGTVEASNLPVIHDGGDLVIQVPFYGIAAATDYPAVAAWLASFTSSVAVTNNAPFILQVIESPFSVTFTATNQYGTRTLTRALTVTVANLGSELEPNNADLRVRFPYFNNRPVFSYQAIELSLDAAMCSISNANAGRLQGECRLRAIYLMAAHLLYIQVKRAASGGNIAPVVGSTVDAVSVQFAAPPPGSQWQWWLTTTPYGNELLGLLRANSSGGWYIPGSTAQRGFRKSNGGF